MKCKTCDSVERSEFLWLGHCIRCWANRALNAEAMIKSAMDEAGVFVARSSDPAWNRAAELWVEQWRDGLAKTEPSQQNQPCAPPSS
jgi:hypothetical protein